MFCSKIAFAETASKTKFVFPFLILHPAIYSPPASQKAGVSACCDGTFKNEKSENAGNFQRENCAAALASSANAAATSAMNARVRS
jgi:hypothetical protein